MGGVEIVRGVGLLEVVRRFYFGIVGVGVPDDPVMRSITKNDNQEHAGGRRGRRPLREYLLIIEVRRKRGIPAETPQHYHHTTLPNNCQLSVPEKLWILCFIPNFRKLFVLFPIL